MRPITNVSQPYAWGSRVAIPMLLGATPSDEPVAEYWMGAHPSAPSRVLGADGGAEDGVPLDRFVAEDPARRLGEDVVARFGPSLPYLLKVIAADRPLSMQVHPDLAGARVGYTAEEQAGIPRDDPRRNYKDANHKPELVYALSRFEALCGFRAPRRAAELVEHLDAPLARTLHAVLRSSPSVEGIRTVFRRLLEPSTRPDPDEVAKVVEACRRRLADGSPSPRADRTVVLLGEEHPGDPAVVTSLLLNPVTLDPGDALFVPAGGVHLYLRGLGVEIMANSDNVLRAGLTSKPVDVAELLANVDYVAAPPIRIAPERFHGATKVFYAPVDDFELSVTTVTDGATHPIRGRGPRILLCLEGEIVVTAAAVGAPDDGELGELRLRRGQSAFVPACDGALRVRGTGTVVQADVP